MKSDYVLGRIEAVLYASETVVNHPRVDEDTKLMTKEYAYDNIVKILKDMEKEDDAN